MEYVKFRDLEKYEIKYWEFQILTFLDLTFFKLCENLSKNGMRIVPEVFHLSVFDNLPLTQITLIATPTYTCVLYLPPPLALLSGGEAAGVGITVHGQLRPVAPQHVWLGGSPTHSQILL